MALVKFFLGEYRLSTRSKNAAKLLNLCMKKEIEYSRPLFKDGDFFVSCHKKEAEMLLSSCQKSGIEISVKSVGGFPSVLSAYRKRIGLAVGGLLAVFMVILSLNIVWRIDVKGNTLLSVGDVERILGDNGFSVGDFVRSADLTDIENSVMKNTPSIAWISINMDGTVATVEIRETRKGEEKSNEPANLVAVRDGKIERIESYNGNCAVKVGDVVKNGDILVSGIYADETGTKRVTRAEGEIYARTVRQITVEIPYETTEKVYTGREKSEIYINFFKKSIKVFANTGNLPPSCDIIYENGEVGLDSMPKIPVGINKTHYLEYEEIPVTLNETQAMEKAFSVLEAEMKLISDKLELLSKNTEFEITDSAYILKCSLVCIENIAEIIEINLK